MREFLEHEEGWFDSKSATVQQKHENRNAGIGKEALLSFFFSNMTIKNAIVP